MKKFFTLIAAALMSLGVSAGDYTAPLTTTWSVQGGSNAAGVFTDTETHYYNNWGTSGWAAQAYTQFSLDDIPEGETVTKATYTVTLNCDRGTRNADVTVLPVGSDPADYQVLKAKADCGTQVAAYSDITTSYATKTIDVTEQVKAALANGDSYIIMAISNGAASGNIYGKAGATPPTLSISTVDASSMSGYIVKYMYNDTEIQKADTLPGVKGDAITLTNSQKANIYTEDTKYIYASDDASAFTVGEDTVTVTVKFREAEVYDYTYNAKLGDSEYLLKKGQSFEGDEVTVYYPKYMLEGTTLYTSGAYPFRATFTPTSTNYEAYKQYNVAEENSNVVLYSEAEDILDVIPFEDGNTEIRMSGGAVGEADSIAVATLTAGKYTLTSSTRSGETKFYVEGENILTLSSTGAVTDATSSEFIIKKDGTSVMAKNVLTSNHKNYFDYVLIRRTGDYNYFEIEANLPDTITVTLGEVEDYAKLNLSDYISVNTNAEEYFPVINYAVAEEGVDKKDATYTPVLSEQPLYEVFTEPGTYYVFANVVAVFADENVDNVSTDTIVVVLKEKETETIGVEPGIWYSYIYTATGVSTTPAVDTEGGTFSAGGTKVSEENNSHIGIKTNFTATVTLGRALKENDIITLKIWAGSANVNSGLDISTDGTTSLHYFQLPSTNAKTNVYDVQYIVKADDGICGLSEFKISKITGSPNVYLNGVTVEVPEMKAPEFTAQPAGKTIIQDNTVTLTAAAAGFPEPTYQWSMNGEVIEGATEASYTFTGSETGDFIFTVTATNSEGEATSSEAMVTVIEMVNTLENDAYAVAETDKVADMMTISTPSVDIFFAENGGFTITAADAEEAPAGYTSMINGSSNPSVSGDVVKGTAYRVYAKKNGVFTFVCKVNAGKEFNIVKVNSSSSAKAAAGSLQANSLEAMTFTVGDNNMTSGDKFDATYNGPIDIEVDENTSYYIYASGSKVGMYGFDFTEATAVDGVSEAQKSVKKEGKFIENGQIVILKAGKKFNAAGAQIK